MCGKVKMLLAFYGCIQLLKVLLITNMQARVYHEQ